MIYTSIALFALAALFGLTMLIKWLRKEDAPRGVAYIHGIVAALALVILIMYGVGHPDHFPKISIILFIIAALGGIFMFIRDVMKKPPIIPLAFVHALLAVSGLVTLLMFVFG
jgi:hypothetical protein